MKNLKQLAIIGIILLNSSCIFATMPLAKIKCKVINENGKPIENVEISSYNFFTLDMIKTKKEIAYTNSNSKGICFLSGRNRGYGGVRVVKDGFYTGNQRYDFKNKRTIDKLRWEPYPANVTITLRKKKNPVAMFAKRTTWIDIPVFEKPVGYDLEKGNWVAPHGKGGVSDFIIKYQGQQQLKDKWNAETSIILTFSNEHDGIQKYNDKENIQSYYKWAYEAPNNEYNNKLSKILKFEKDKGQTTNINEKNKFVFRVRTKVDKDGNIISAKYGKILGDFNLTYTGKIKFIYYYNPNGTRNLEFDTEKNLFKFDKRKEWENMVKEP